MGYQVGRPVSVVEYHRRYEDEPVPGSIHAARYVWVSDSRKIMVYDIALEEGIEVPEALEQYQHPSLEHYLVKVPPWHIVGTNYP